MTFSALQGDFHACTVNTYFGKRQSADCTSSIDVAQPQGNPRICSVVHSELAQHVERYRKQFHVLTHQPSKGARLAEPCRWMDMGRPLCPLPGWQGHSFQLPELSGGVSPLVNRTSV